jgi:hypothetical protein
LFIHLTGHLGNDEQMAKCFPDVDTPQRSILAGCSGWNSPIKRRASYGNRSSQNDLGPQGKTEMKFVHILCPAAALFFAGCASNGEIDVTSGVGVTATRTGCPTVGVVDGTGDITTFNPASSQDASAVDVVASITKVRPGCNDAGEKIYSIVNFEVQASRRDTRGARSVTLPYFSSVVQGGSAVVAKRVGNVTINFADGQDRATATGKAASYIDPASARLPAEIIEKITKKRKPGDTDAALDPMADPEVKAAVQRASFEMLVGFQLTEAQLRYNMTR